MPEGRAFRSAGESLLPEERLRKRADFLRCYEQGRRRRGKLTAVYVVEREPCAQQPRLGVTVTRRVGGAVVRHRVKRRIKEIYRRWSKRTQLPPYDILVHAMPAAREADFSALQAEIHRQLAALLEDLHRAG